MFRFRSFSLLLILVLTITSAATFERQSYRALDSELGIVYRPPSVSWDAAQWDAIFQDPAPPMGWAILPVGRETCNAVSSSWLSKAKSKGFRLAILTVPFLTVEETKRTVDCSRALGFQRIILDEYISYQTRTLRRPLCTVLSEVREMYNYSKSKYPGYEFAIDDNWHVWAEDLSRTASHSCSPYPYFRVDLTGVSVLSKYGNPAQKGCGHPTAEEMSEQLVDLRYTLRDYSKSKRIFVWQLNQNWYPGGSDVLQFFRTAKVLYGWERFFLFGPTTDIPKEENWGYRTKGFAENCNSADYEWHLPAREYLIRIAEGADISLTLQGPSSTSRGSTVALSGNIRAANGIGVGNIQLRVTQPLRSVQRFGATVTSPSNALLAFVGARVNTQLPNNIRGDAEFLLQRAQMFESGSTSNLVSNGEFDQDFSNWFVLSTAPVSVISDGGDKALSLLSSRNQFLSITSGPIVVAPNRKYTIVFDARVHKESRNHAYFFVGWNNPGEIRRDRFFLKSPEPKTIAATSSTSGGSFRFIWQPMIPGVHTLSAFYPGSSIYRPAISTIKVTVE